MEMNIGEWYPLKFEIRSSVPIVGRYFIGARTELSSEVSRTSPLAACKGIPISGGKVTVFGPRMDEIHETVRSLMRSSEGDLRMLGLLAEYASLFGPVPADLLELPTLYTIEMSERMPPFMGLTTPGATIEILAEDRIAFQRRGRESHSLNRGDRIEWTAPLEAGIHRLSNSAAPYEVLGWVVVQE